MEVLADDKIQAWLDVGYGNGNGDGYGRGYGNGDGYGYGYGDGYGNGYGDGRGRGYGRSYGNGDGDGYGYGSGDGYGYGNGDGDGDGNGDGRGNGYGRGYGNGYGIQEYNGHRLYKIDNIPTAILSVHGNVARGFVLDRNVTKHPCYIVKDNGKFAHGDTLRDAFTALQEKLYDGSTEEERIAAFMRRFPCYDTPYPNRDLFAYHHVLTGSCRMGREQFCKSRGIDLDGETTVREFVALTRDSYGGGIISKLPRAYGIG